MKNAALQLIRPTIHPLLHSKITVGIRQLASCENYIIYIKSPLPISTPTIYVTDNLAYTQKWKHDTGIEEIYELLDASITTQEITTWVKKKHTALFDFASPAITGCQIGSVVIYNYSFYSGYKLYVCIPLAKTPEQNIEANEIYNALYPHCNSLFKFLSRQYNLKALAEKTIQELTRKELNILRLVAEGYNAEQIASRVFVSKATVYFHIKQSTKKMNCCNKTQAIAKAAILGLL
ncbi:response regulator transcription factor [Pseudomonas sp. P2757]|uniref:response regulator transcription factor n=1 Tax=unclassified Pseudomonas TaxID=196821 RepID=UPI003B5CF409